jgi:protein-disulfide isomerase
MKRRIGALGAALLVVTTLGPLGACARPADDAQPVDEGKRGPAGAAQKIAGTTVHRVPIEGAPARGDARAPVTLVAFTDYECPFCKRADATVEQLRKRYGSKLRVVVRQFPLPFHANARAAAIAAMAADEQGQFWAMHERLFGNTRALDEESLARIAGEAGLDVPRWQRARAAAAASVDRDQALGKTLGVEGTPAFFVNGRKIQGAQSIDGFAATIDEEIARASAMLAIGVRPEDVYATLMKGAADTAVVARAAPAGAAAEAKKDCDAPGADCGCKGEPEAEDAEPARVEDVPLGASPVRGPERAPLTVVVFSDFQCPFCARSEATLRAMEEEFGGRVRFAFKNQPLPFHDHARLAAKAALAAGEQGKFWEYHDALFAHQDALEPAALERYAQGLGLDLARFRKAMESERVEAALAADAADATRLGVQGTPTFFVNGRRIIGAQPIAGFRAAAAAALGERR